MNSHKPNGFFHIPSYIYISQNVLYVSDFLFTYIMIVKYMINKSLNQGVGYSAG